MTSCVVLDDVVRRESPYREVVSFVTHVRKAGQFGDVDKGGRRC
jgi:hypothetical protein